MKANQAEFTVDTMCRLLGVSTSGYYSWLGRGESARAAADRVISDEISKIWKESARSYGAPRIHAVLTEQGIRLGRKRVARLMRGQQINGISRRKETRRRSVPAERPAPDLVARRFQADGPNQLWVADITEIPTGEGPLQLAVVIDVWSRRVVGWNYASHHQSELVTGALDMAAAQREASGVIHHSDQGPQYTSIAFGQRCRQHGVIPSMGTVGDCYDNALAESFFATLETEHLAHTRYPTRYPTRDQARQGTFRWIEGWYNPHRRHSAIGNLSPIEYERRNWPT